MNTRTPRIPGGRTARRTPTSVAASLVPAVSKITHSAAADAASVQPVAPRQTKAARLRAMLEAPGGASMAGMMAATGWQAHTVRAALSGLRKAGLALSRNRIEGDGTDSERVYQIVAAQAGEAPAAAQAGVPGDTTAETSADTAAESQTSTTVGATRDGVTA